MPHKAKNPLSFCYLICSMFYKAVKYTLYYIGNMIITRNGLLSRPHPVGPGLSSSKRRLTGNEKGEIEAWDEHRHKHNWYRLSTELRLCLFIFYQDIINLYFRNWNRCDSVQIKFTNIWLVWLERECRRCKTARNI